MPIKSSIGKTSYFHQWLFSKETRVIEFLNAALLLGFTLPFLYNFDAILNSDMYLEFYLAGNPLWWVGMVVLGVLQVIAMVKKGVRSNQVSGFVLLVSAWVWSMIASIFVAASPPLTPAPVIYSIISFTCAAAGLYLLKYNKAIEDKFYKGR